MIAKKAEMKDFKIKCMVWGEPGTGKSRFALTAPKPLVIDLENSTALYANEFDFYRATVDQSKNSQIDNACKLTKAIIQEIADECYTTKIETLVIDPISDLLDNLESILVSTYQNSIGKNIQSLNQLQKTKWYSYRRDNTRKLLDKIISLNVNIIFVARSKKLWANTSDGMKPIGNTYDCLEIIEYLTDVVIYIDKNGVGEITKSRIKELKTGKIETNDWNVISKSLNFDKNFDNKIKLELIEDKKIIKCSL